MYELPPNLNNRFFLYLTALPAIQEVAIYFLFLTGIGCLFWSITKILTYKLRDPTMRGHWLKQELQSKNLNHFNNKRQSLKTKNSVDSFCNTRFISREVELKIDPVLLEELIRLKEDIV